MSNPVAPIITEIKALADKAIGQAVALGSDYLLIAHHDWTKLETGLSVAVAAGVGYVVNKLRGIKL